MHWCNQYIGREWTEKRDCGKWFRIWSRLYFGRRVPPIVINHNCFLISATKIAGSDLKANFGYEKTNTPKEGDVALLTQRKRPHHVGMIVCVDDELQVLHALEGVGVVLSDMMSLTMNGWKVAGYYTPTKERYNGS